MSSAGVDDVADVVEALPSDEADEGGGDSEVVLPAGGVLYTVDSSRASFGELWRDTRSPLVLITWLTKLLRVRLPGGVNDPNVEALRPFETSFDQLPDDVRADLVPKLDEWASLGFDTTQAVVHRIVDRFGTSKHFLVNVPHADQLALARLGLRLEGTHNPPRKHQYAELISQAGAGRFVVSTSAKASQDVPSSVVMQRHPGATPSKLWSVHEAALGDGVGAEPMHDPRGLLDRYHFAVRDFHLERGVFRERTEAEQQVTVSLEGAAGSAGLNADVVAEMERQLTASPNRRRALILLVVSLVAFVVIGIPGANESNGLLSWDTLGIIVGVLLFHEAGHWIAMKLLGYRNVKMFFLPMFGAAVSGRHLTAPGWKRVVVSLAGPLPGIVVGVGLAVWVFFNPDELLGRIAHMLLILNAFNLLPLLPLDGGRVMQSVLFARAWQADIVFRIIGAVGMILLGALVSYTAGTGRFGVSAGLPLLIFGGFMLMGIPVAVQLGKLTEQLRDALPPPEPSDDRAIPPTVANKIVERVRGLKGFKHFQGSKTLATHALGVYEALCTRPPGWAASVAFVALQGSAFLVAIFVAAVSLVTTLPGFNETAWVANNRPDHVLDPTTVRVALPPVDESVLPDVTVVGRFPDESSAASAFDQVRGELDAGQQAALIGHGVIVTIRGDDAGRVRWLDELETLGADTFVWNNDGGLGFTISATILDPAEADRIISAATGYLQTRPDKLIPPWSPQWSADTADYRLARQTYVAMQSVGYDAVEPDPEELALNQALMQANRRGDEAEAERLLDQLSAINRKQRADAVAEFRAGPADEVDRELVDLVFALEVEEEARWDEIGNDLTDEAWDAFYEQIDAEFGPESPRMNEIWQRMGVFDADANEGSRRHATSFAQVADGRPIVSFNYINFQDPVVGIPAFIEWLETAGATDVRYSYGDSAVEMLESLGVFE
ncbi:MAG: site-2 protease family protein [Planctomycetota bacterium]